MGGSKGCLVKLLLMVKEPRAAPYSLVAAARGTTRHHSPPAEWQPPAPASRHQHNNLAGLPWLCEKVVMKNAPCFAISRQIDSFNIKLHIAHGRGILAEYFQPLIFGF